ncbi:MAG: HD domain-containing protein [Candidatus Latescibacteria bacterium]|jgi:uncharacterized protein|nr:HD domain-containing protein [Candidatus Latescibacterota bacterium]
MDRLECVRGVVDGILAGQEDMSRRRAGFVHLYGVSTVCVLLAIKRGLNPEVAGVAGMLHDVATYESGSSKEHAARGSVRAGEILAEIGRFAAEEITEISEAISTHSTKVEDHGPMAELLKDADVLQPYLYDPAVELSEERKRRLEAMMGELRLTRHGGA